MKCSRWLLVAVCFLGLSWVCLAPDALITVSGVVRGPDGPMAGIFVWTECPPFPGTRTDANGRFSFEIEPLCREVVIVITPVQTNLAQASVRLGSPIEDVELDIELGSGYRLSGQILNNDGCPVAPNYDFFDSLGRKYTLEFDAYARFDTILPPDEYLLQLKPLDGSEGETKRISVDLRSGDVEELVILFNAASALPCLRSPLEREDLGPIEVSGVVRGPDGPMAGIFVWTECPPFPGTRTDTEGAFSIDIEPLCNDVVIVTPPLETNLAQISIRLDHPMNDVQLDIRLSPGHRLSGRVFNIDGCPTVVNHELYASDGRRFTLGLDRDARFDIRLPPDLYDLQMYPPHGSQSEAQHVMIDLRNTSLEGLIVSYNFGSEWLNWGFRPGQEFFEDEPAPLIEHIIFSIIRDDGTRSIRGEAGAIPPGVSNVSLVNLTSGDAAVVHVNEDGSFEAGLFAPEGSFIYAKYARWDGCPDPTYIRGPITGTILRAPANPDVTRDETEFVLSGGMYPEGHWWAEGRVDRLDYSAEDRMTIEGELTLLSRVAAEQLLVGRHTVTLQVELERLTNASGDQILRINRGVSTQVAPTGLPIENGSDGRHSNYTPLSLKWTVQVDETHRDGDKLRIPFSVGGCLPADLAPGLYRPVIWISTNRPGIGIGYHSYVDVAAGELSGAENNMSFGLPVVSIGEPAAPQVPWMLFCNTFSNGQRGLRAREDHDVVGLSTKVLFPTDGFILPPNEETVIRYRLEPFAPTICSSMSEDVEPSPPLIPFAFPSGSLTVMISRPDGTIDTLGPAPFAQSRCGMTEMENGYYISADRTIMALYELTTLDDGFLYEFDQCGHYVIEMKGSIDDVHGRAYNSSGTYDVYVAKPLDLEPAVLPGTPFEVGDAFAPAVVVHPSFPARVEVSVRHYPDSNPDRLVHHVVEGRANRFGYFAPGPFDSFIFDGPGEYVADVSAEYWDEDGVLWMGQIRGASVVASPVTPLVAHGERGIRSISMPRPQWFFQRDIHPQGLGEVPVESPPEKELLSGMINLPYQTGDVVWIAHWNNTLSNELTFQDTVGLVEQFMLSRTDQYTRNGVNCAQDIRERISIGEIPFIHTTDNGWDGRLHPEHVDQMGYFYMAVGRPGVGVRNYVAQDGLFRAYWTTDYRYNRQLGTGMEGDRPNDLKYQFGGGVFRLLNGPGTDDDENHYVIHGSIEALVPMGTEFGNRTTSPFQGNAGGPDGGPLLTLKGEDIDLCIHPTAIRPGEILEIGDTFSFAGQMFPAVAAKATVSVVSPSGELHRFDSEANKIGYFYEPTGDIVLTEFGIYQVTVTVLFDGVVSDGQAVPPYPTGVVLGSSEGIFYIYVVDPQSPAIKFALDAPEGRIPCSHVRWPITGALPSEWEAVRGHYTVWMAGVLLDQGTLALDGNCFTYVFDPLALHKDFPNLDIGEAPGQFPELVDTITISFLVEGTNASGMTEQFAGRVDLQGLEYVVSHQGGG